MPGEAGEQGTGPPGQYHHPPVLVELQRPAQAEFSLADRPGQPLRARNNRTAGEDARASGSDPSGGTASGGSGKTASPGTPSGSRLVASTRSPGQAPSRFAVSAAQAPGRCSQLSSTSSKLRGAQSVPQRLDHRRLAGLPDP